MSGKRWLWAMALLLAAGCGGRTRLVEVDGLPSTGNVLDFGSISVGTRATHLLDFVDDGRAPVQIDGIEIVSGTHTFSAKPEAQVVRGVGGKTHIQVVFHPESEGAFGDELVIHTNSTAIPELHVKLRGVGGPAAVQFDPPLLDWGGLETGDQRTLSFDVINPTDLNLTLSSDAPDNEFELSGFSAPPGRTHMTATYHAGALGQRHVTVSATPCATCTRVPLHGKGLALQSAIQMDPNPLTWNGVPVHHESDGTATLKNLSWRDLNIDDLNIDGTDFAVVSGPKGQVLAAGSSLPVTVRFAPQHQGETQRTLTVRYRSFAPRSGTGQLLGLGGGPQIAVTPRTLSYDDLPVGGKERLFVYIQNAGTYRNLEIRGLSGLLPPFEASLPNGASIAPGDELKLPVDFEPTQAGSFTATLHIQSNDPASPDVTVDLSGTAHPAGPCTFSLTPQALDFGNVPPGSGAVLGFRFADTGNQECAVKDIELDPSSDPAFFMPGGALVGGDLHPTDAFSAQVAFKSPGAGTFHGRLNLTVNDPTNPHPSIPITAVSQDSCLVAAPPFIDFGAVRLDCSAHDGTTVVTNQCTTPVVVTGADIGQGTLNEFSFSSLPNFPVTLNPGATFPISATYARSALGQQYAPLYIHGQNDPAPLMVPLLGETLHEGDQFDQFIQGSGNQADVLFVVSNTNTMGPYQQRLAAAVTQLISAAQAAGIDLHVGVTTTGLTGVANGAACTGGANGGEAGRLVPADGTAPRIITLNTGNALQVLQQNVQPGTCQNLEQGLESMRLALSPPLSDHADDPRTSLPNDGNAGFLRAGARLAVVVLADEDDHSGFDPAVYVQFLKSLKGLNGAHRTALYAIVPKTGMCQTAGAPGDRFSTVAQQTGGAVYEVCEGDYGPYLQQLAQRGLGDQSIFELSAVPTGNLTVKENGQVIGGGDYYYDANFNAVVFNPGHIPAAGTQIEVDYRSACP